MTVLYKAASTMVTSGKKVRFDVKKIDQVQYAKYHYIIARKDLQDTSLTTKLEKPPMN